MKFIYHFFVAISLLSCSKNDVITPVAIQPALTASIQYRVNGRTVKIFNVNSTDAPYSTVTGAHNHIGPQANYSIIGSLSENNGSVNKNTKTISIIIAMDSIKAVNTYSIGDNANEIRVSILDALFSFDANDNLPGTSFSITITEYKKGLLSGTFRGTFEKSDGVGNSFGLVDITEGIFTDVKIAY